MKKSHYKITSFYKNIRTKIHSKKFPVFLNFIILFPVEKVFKIIIFSVLAFSNAAKCFLTLEVKGILDGFKLRVSHSSTLK